MGSGLGKNPQIHAILLQLSHPAFALYLSSDGEITACEVSMYFLQAVLTLRKVFHVAVCNFSCSRLAPVSSPGPSAAESLYQP